MNHKFSIIIPTYNEEEDIRGTLDACVNLSYPQKEILVIDDSKDQTPAIVKGYESEGVALIHREKNEGGRCGARNEGILRAKGDIVVILNADVILPRDFIDRLLLDYEKGADYVLVESEVINKEYLYARFIDALHKHTYRDDRYLKETWTEGFSCKKEAAVKAGLFPMPPIKLTAGEDGYFGGNLEKLGFRKVFDRSIVVRHYAPYRLRDFWRIFKERVSPQAGYFLDKRPFGIIFLRYVFSSIIFLGSVIIIIPILFKAFDYSRFSPRGMKDFPGFIWAYFIEQLAFFIGKWTGLAKLADYIIKNKK